MKTPLLPTLLIDLEHSTTLKRHALSHDYHEYYLLPSPPGINHAPKQNWDTPTRAKARLLRKERHSYRQISKLTGLPRSTIQSIVKSKSSRRTRKGKYYKSKLLSTRLRWVSACWNNRRASFSQIKATLWLDAYVLLDHGLLKTSRSTTHLCTKSQVVGY
jgi:hypothetical protein